MLLNFWYPYFVQFTGDAAVPVAGSTTAFVSLMLQVSVGSFFGCW